MAVVRSRFWFPLLMVVSAGCSSEIEHHPHLVSDRAAESGESTSNPASSTGSSTDTGSSTGTGTSSHPEASSCDVATSWEAGHDFTVESAPGTFADVVSNLVRAASASPIAVNSRVDANCVWSVAFSAVGGADATAIAHPATFTPMQRHPAGLWTAAPQPSGWLRVVDAASQIVWIPLADATGSANYAVASCAELSDVRVSAVIPRDAGSAVLVTREGPRTLQSLLGTPYGRGWDVRFAFSAVSAH